MAEGGAFYLIPERRQDMNSLALSFNDVNLKPLPSNDHHVWIGSTQIGLALGYANPETAITKIFNRKSDEFTSDMTLTVKLTVNGINGSVREKETRIFSLRGAHLITFFEVIFNLVSTYE